MFSEEALAWQRDTAALLRECGEGLSFAKRARLQGMDNGDPASKIFSHWCRGCCKSKSHAFFKMHRVYMDAFIRGFLVPLLYRWNGYEPAKAYLLRGLGLHNFLIQVFEAMAAGKMATVQESIAKLDAGKGKMLHRKTQSVSTRFFTGCGNLDLARMPSGSTASAYLWTQPSTLTWPGRAE